MSTFDEYLGVVTRSHGLDGTMVLTDVVAMPRPLLRGSEVAIGYSRDFTTVYQVEEFSSMPNRTTLRLRSVTTAEAVTPLIDQAVYARSADVGIDQSQRYRIGDVEGCSVFDEQGSLLGTISDVWLMPANDVWVVTADGGRTIPLPVINDVVLNVDLPNRRITVRLLPGLADVDSAEGERDDS
ncbi:MAG: 16S rRNA processing protein RimM [Candidatus Kapabacteria bacterium]|nr:16S rRNA processing protein RimM [Candidatus Kapabacteria bacterium]